MNENKCHQGKSGEQGDESITRKSLYDLVRDLSATETVISANTPPHPAEGFFEWGYTETTVSDYAVQRAAADELRRRYSLEREKIAEALFQIYIVAGNSDLLALLAEFPECQITSKSQKPTNFLLAIWHKLTKKPEAGQ